MILIKDMHDFIRGLIKKNKGGFVSPVDIDRAVNRASIDWMSAILYKYKKSGKFEFDHLLVKRKAYSVTSSATSIVTVPTDYVEGLTVYISNNGVLTEGTLYNWDEFLEITNSSILAPDVLFPAATIYLDETGAKTLQLFPYPTSGTYNFTFVYFKEPTSAVYNYTPDNYGNFTYNATGTVNLDWDSRYFGDIAARALVYLGVTLDSQVLLSIEGLKDVNQRNDER